MARLAPVVGTEIVDDIRLGHTWEEYNVLKEFIFKEDPDFFVEVGVHEGGLAYLLIPELNNTSYVGIEIDCSIVRPEVKALFEKSSFAELLCANCFSNAIVISMSMLQFEKKIIYCDGGNKVKELHHFKQFCNPGDVIMAHDFWDSDRKVHGVPEIHPEVLPMDVLHLDMSDNFTRLNENIFKETRIIGWRKNNE